MGPTMPAWLDLHGAVDKETCEALRALTLELQRTEPLITDLAKRAYAVLGQAEAINDLPEDVFDEVTLLSGYKAACDGVLMLASHLLAAIGEEKMTGLPRPEWVIPERERLGLRYPIAGQADAAV